MKYQVFPLMIVLSACTATEHAPAPVYNAMIEQRDSSAGAHMVSSDEDLHTIAKNYNLTIDDILHANNLADANQIGAGQRLYLPSGNNGMRHTVVSYSAPSSSPPANTTTYVARAVADENTMPVFEALPQQAAINNDPVASEPLSPIGNTSLSEMASSAPVQKVEPAITSEPTRVASNIASEQWNTPVTNGFRWPVRGPTLSAFGEKAGGLRNDGINIGATSGTAVEAAADGEVVYKGDAVDGFGNLVLIKHKDNFVTAYGHLSRVDVAKGQTVRAGDIIGGVGKTGSVTAPQLHFQVRKAGGIVNPTQFLSNGSVMGSQTAGL